ncbi:hypothetical protein, partial [Saccharibacillus sp. WB 17]|uniref:hypothetical protein n=1 Tax=Saccharibacillus sp. WB 17 TaxID=2603535 RepID=UPI001F389A92
MSNRESPRFNEHMVLSLKSENQVTAWFKALALRVPALKSRLRKCSQLNGEFDPGSGRTLAACL